MTRIHLLDSPSSDSLDYNTDNEISDAFTKLWTSADEDPHLYTHLEELLVQREAMAKADVQRAQKHLKFIDEETAQMRRLLREKIAATYTESAIGHEMPLSDPSADDCILILRTNLSASITSDVSESGHTSETLRPSSVKRADQQIQSASDDAHESFPREDGMNETEHLLRERYEDEIERMWENAVQERSYLDAQRRSLISDWRAHVFDTRDFTKQSNVHLGNKHALPLNEDDLWEAALSMAIEQSRAEAEERAIIEQWEREKQEEVRIQEETAFTENMELAAELAAPEDLGVEHRLRTYESNKRRKSKEHIKEMLKQSGTGSVRRQGNPTVVTGSSRIGVFTCTECPSIFSRGSDLSTHMKLHTHHSSCYSCSGGSTTAANQRPRERNAHPAREQLL